MWAGQFKIDPSRGSEVLVEVPGKEFDWVLGCDYFSAYRKYMEDCGIAVQFRLAHLIREVRFLLTLPDRATRFRKHGAAYFRFITTPGVEPTNNLAEQAMRFVVIDRRITQGTRREHGRQWCERIWTLIATQTQQGRSILAYLRDAIHAHLSNQPAPALLPTKP
jgi:hypothetical protein